MTTVNKRIALYPGTFDPITNGHLDIIERSIPALCDRLVIGIAVNKEKKPLFDIDKRLELVRHEINNHAKLSSLDITVRSFSSLLVQCALEEKANIIIRGLRAVSDFEFELQLTNMNSKLAPNLQTIFLMASDNHQFISSKLVKEIALFGGDVHKFVPANIQKHLRK